MAAILAQNRDGGWRRARRRSRAVITANWRICSRCVPRRQRRRRGAVRQGDADAHRADRHAVLLGRAGDTGQGQARRRRRARRRAPSAISTAASSLTTGPGATPSSVELHLAGVGHDARRGTRRWLRGSRSAGPATSPPVSDSARPSVQPRGAQHVEHDRLHRVVVDAEHDRARATRRTSASHVVEHVGRRLRRVGLAGRQPDLEPVPPAGQEGQRRVAGRRRAGRSRRRAAR